MTLELRKNKMFMGLFTSLTSDICKERIIASERLLKFLGNVDDDKHKQVLDYSLLRLVRGLSSSRQQSRVGFAMALTQIQRHISGMSIHQLHETMHKALKPPQAASKKEMSNIQLAKLLVHLSVIQAAALINATDKELLKTVSGIKEIRFSKEPLHGIATQSMKLLISQVSEEQFRKQVMSVLQPELTGGWEKCSPDTLSLLLAARKHHQAVITETFLEKHWQTKTILDKKNWKHIARITQASASDHPVLHPVCEQLVELVPKSQLANFWKQVFAGLLESEKYRHRYLGLMLVPSALRLCSSKQQVTTIISASVVKLLLRNASTDGIMSHATDVVTEAIADFGKNSKNAEVKVALIVALCGAAPNLQFDSLTKTHTVSHLINALTTEEAEIFAQICLDALTGKQSIGEEAPPMAQLRWACQYLSAVISSIPNQQTRYLRFLVLHAYFMLKQTASDTYKDSALVVWRSSEVAQIMRQTYLTTMKRVTAAGTSARSKDQYIEMLHSLTQYVQELIDSPKCVVPDFAWDDTLTKCWTESMALVTTIRTQSCVSPLHSGFALLLLHLSLELLEGGVAALELIEPLSDIHACYERAAIKQRRGLRQEDELSWVEVLTELMLSLLARPSHTVRSLVRAMFNVLDEQMTPQAVEIILQTLLSNDEDQMAFENSDEEMEAEEEESNDREIEEKGEDSESEDESEEEEEEEVEDDVRINEDVRSAVKKALGNAAVESDEESELEDFTDEEMFKLDATLAAAFRAMKKGKKDNKQNEKQIIDFKIRVVDLLPLLTSQPALLLPVLRPLQQLCEAAMRDKNMSELAAKSGIVYDTLCRSKSNTEEPVDIDAAMECLKDLLKMSTEVSTIYSIQKIAAGCIFVVRLLLGTTGQSLNDYITGTYTNKKQTKKVMASVYTIFKEHLHQIIRGSNQKMMLFTSILEKQDVLMWPMLNDIFDLIESDTVKVYNKTKLFGMLSSLLTKRMIKQFGQDCLPELATRIGSICKKIIKVQLTEEKTNVKLIINMLQVLQQVVSVSKDDIVKTEFSILEEIETMRSMADSRDMRRACNPLIAVLQVRLGQAGSKKKKMAKKRPAEDVDTVVSEDTVTIATDDTAVTIATDGTAVTNGTSEKQKKKKKKKKAANERITISNGSELKDNAGKYGLEQNGDITNSSKKSDKAKKKKHKK